MSDVFEVVIVGAGPAGSLAAYHLARAGRRVLLLDRERLPRYKPCGGGVTVKSLSELPFPVDEVVERDVCEAEIWFGNDRVIRAHGDQIGRMVMRSAFDAHLVRQAVGAGAVCREGVRVRSVRPSVAGQVTIDTDEGALDTRCVIGADGANSVVARAVGLDQAIEWGVAIEGEVDPPPGADILPRVVFDFRGVPSGYAYVFPKSGHYSVGVYTMRPALPRLRAYSTVTSRARRPCGTASCARASDTKCRSGASPDRCSGTAWCSQETRPAWVTRCGVKGSSLR